MGFLRRLFGGSPSSGDAEAWLLTPRPDAVLDIVGEQSYQDALRRLGGPLTSDGPTRTDFMAVLIAEPQNRYDKNAIRVQIDGERVGYLSRENAMLYGPVIRWALGKRHDIAAEARLTGGWESRPR